MKELLLIGNPARRKSHRKPSAAQLRARAKFAAASRARGHKRRAAPRHHAVARANPARRRYAAVRHHRKIRRNPARRHTVGANLSMNSVMTQLKSAGIGAAGAIGVDAVYGFAQSYLPASLSTETDSTGATQYGYYAAKGAVAFGVGMLLSKMIGAQKAAHVVQGSLTVTLHKMMTKFMGANVQSVALGKYIGVPTPMHRGLRGIPGGRAMPPLPASQTLQKYIGAGVRESVVR